MARKSTKKKTPTPKPELTPAQKWVEDMKKDQYFKGKMQAKIATELYSSYTLRRPTGILSLDLALGGGLHSSGGTQIHGAESVGKTHLAYRVAAQVQKNYGDESAILIYSNEIKPDKGFARMAEFCIGYSPEEIEEYEKLRVRDGLPPFTKEEREDLSMQIGDVVVVTADTADTGLEGVVKALETGIFQLVIIESLGALLPKEIDEKKLEEDTYGGSSKVLTKFQNKIYPLFMMEREDGTSLETTVIGINQARAKIGAPPRGKKTKPAADAFAWKHGQLASIELGRGDFLKDKDKIIGKYVTWYLSKGKAGTHDGKRGSFRYFHFDKMQPVFWRDVREYWLGGIDTTLDAVEVGKSLGLVEVNGAWLTWVLDKDTTERVKAQGTENFAKLLNENKHLLGMFWDACLKKSGLLVRYR